MATIGDLVVNLSANSQQFSRQMSRSQKSVQGFGKTVAKVAAGLGAMFATRASIQAAQVQIAAEKKLAAVITATGGASGFSADQIKQYAAELQAVTNFGDEATISAAAVLATFKNIKGDEFLEALAIAQDMSAVFGQDLQSSIVQVGKALDDPIRGASALRRIGVSLSEQESERIRQLQEQGDILGAQQILLQALETQVGGAAEAMADPLTQANNAIGDIGEAIGIAALELVTAATNATNFQEIAAKIVSFIEQMTLAFKRFGVLAGDIARNIGDAFGTVFANLANAAMKLGSMMLRGLKGEGISFDELNELKDALSNPLEGVRFKLTDLNQIQLDIKKGVAAGAAIPALAVPEGGAVPGIIPGVELVPKTEGIDAGGLGLPGDRAGQMAQQQTQLAEAATEGSQSAFSSILKNVLGKQDKAADKTAKNTEETVEVLGDILDAVGNRGNSVTVVSSLV